MLLFGQLRRREEWREICVAARGLEVAIIVVYPVRILLKATNTGQDVRVAPKATWSQDTPSIHQLMGQNTCEVEKSSGELYRDPTFEHF